jgi:NAD(P)-dependent dehydrogenase (short-subunit alcohol dehydrogenase family)
VTEPIARSLADRRVVIVGASSGIGEAVALQAVAGGARIVVAARRHDRLTSLVEQCGEAAHAITCDVRDAESCAELIARSVDVLGGLDAVVYSTAIDPLRKLLDTDAALWNDVLATNVVGASLVCRAAVPHLAESHGRYVFVSATSVGRPLPGMGAYETSKAAVEELARAWRGEHPEIGFSTIAVGNTLGTEVTASWDPTLLAELGATWAERGYIHDNGPGAMTVDAAAAAVLSVLVAPADLQFVLALPPPGSTMENPGGP